MAEQEKYIPVNHGVDCEKVDHLGDGYLHDPADDSPYNVDGLAYCGKCHAWLGYIPPS